MSNNPDSNVAPTTVVALKGDITRTEKIETYNPRERTFIAKPESKICPHCGQFMPPDIKPMKNAMNVYVNEIGVSFVMNETDETLNIKGVLFGRADGRDKNGKPTSSFLPVAQTAPVQPVKTSK